MLVTCNDDYTLGYRVVDDGHALLVDAINRLNRATSRAHRDGEVAGLLPLLERHFIQQFADEESFLRLLHSDNQAEHKAEHDHLLSVLAHLRLLFAKGEDVAGALMLNLVCYLVSHLRGTDQDDFGGARKRWAA